VAFPWDRKCNTAHVDVPQLQLWNERRGEARPISHENWEYPNWGTSKYFLAINCIHTTYSRRAQTFPDDRPLRMQFCEWPHHTLRMICFYTTFCGQTKHVLRVKVCSTSKKVTSGHRIILVLSANVGIMSASMSASGKWSWDSVCCLTGWLLNISWFRGNYSTGAA
jgi:hypothetical protein